MPNREYEWLRLAVDLVILTVREKRLQVLVIERDNDPFAGHRALPGGFLSEGEDVEAAAKRELAEETSVDGSALHLEQLATYGAPERDPRGRVVSVAYLTLAPDLPIPVAGSDARTARWEPVEEIAGRLAFDHDKILEDAVERARTTLELTTLATAFCAEEFTMSELRTVYEVVWNVQLDPRNFSRKVLSTQGFVEPTANKAVREVGRPAILYRRGSEKLLRPPILRGT